MLKRTLCFSNPCFLGVRLNQLVIKNTQTQEESTCPIEDIGFVILENPQITVTQSVLVRLAQENAAVVFCDETHMPCGIGQAFSGNSEQQQVTRYQIEMSLPVKKNLWKQTVEAKIGNQRDVLKMLGKKFEMLNMILKSVKTDDSSNREGFAAKYYWEQLFSGIPFYREQFGDYPNNFLNYGYAVVRAAISRALVGSGLLTVIGIHHKNKYNANCLADDIMEPFRPFIDLLVFELVQGKSEITELNSEIKATLLSVLTMDCFFETHKSPFMVACSQTTASLVRCIKGEEKVLKYPIIKG